MSVNKADPRDAATVVVVRGAAEGLEVLLLQRAERGDHNSGAWVFPGGLVDAGDRAVADEADPFAAFKAAAIRECFEEAAILFAEDAAGSICSVPPELAALREPLKEGAASLPDLLQRFGLRAAPARLHFIGHWLTPLGRAKRFDTRFFLAIAPECQTALHDAQETLDHVWIAPAEALSPRNSRRLMTPTRAMLELLLPFRETASLAAWAASPRQVERVLPRLALGSAGLQPIMPDHPAYEEIGKLDPQGRCDAWCELRADVPVQLSEHVTRVAGSDGNRYLVRDGGGEWRPVTSLPHLVAHDRIVIAHDAASVPAEMRQAADWLAPGEGFLQRLR